MANSTQLTESSSPDVSIEPLRTGDHLTADEFLRRYEAMPYLKKAELIDGVVYIPSPDYSTNSREAEAMASPVSIHNHSAPHFDLIGWLASYRSATPGILGCDNGTIRLDLKNVPQPDVFLFIKESNGGQARVGDDDFLHGAPELVVEIAYSSVNDDLHRKLKIYECNGAREYSVWRVVDRAFDWFVLREGRYVRIPIGEDGTLRSEVFPGLWLDPEALIRGDLVSVFQTVQRGLATPEHAAFVERLRPAAQGA